MPGEAFAELPNRDDTSEQALQKLSTASALEMIATLPPDQAEAILLRVVIGLDGIPLPTHPDLSSVLAHLAAPAQPAELARENEAAKAFLAVRQHRAPRTRPLRRLVILKISTAAAIVTAGGLAFASGTGILPAPFKPRSPAITPSSPSASSNSTLSNKPMPSSSAETPQALKGLCHAYAGKSKQEKEKSLENPAFQRLATAAGGPEHIEAFCASLPEEKPEKSQAPDAAKPSHPAPNGRLASPR